MHVPSQSRSFFSRSLFSLEKLKAIIVRWPYLTALIAYTCGAIIYTWPMMSLGSTAIPANSIGTLDGWQTTWHLWWSAWAIRHGESPYYTHLLFYPDGVALFWQTLNAPLGILVSPITLLFGPIAAYNSSLLLSFVLGGLFTYLLVYRMTDHRWSAFVAGAIFAFAPFHFNRLLDGSLEHATIQWIPLYVYLLFTVAQDGRWWRFCVAALCFVLVALTSWYYGVYAAVFSMLFALAVLIAYGQKAFARLVVVGILICVCMLPIIQANLFIASNDNNVDYRQALHSADLLDFLMPSPLHPLWGYPWGWLIHDFIGDWNVTLGWSVLGLALIGARAYWRSCWWWFALLLCTLSLVVGPILHVAGVDTGIPMPYFLLNLVPGLRVGQRPVYMIVFAMLALSMLAGYGIKALWPSKGGRIVAWGCMLCAAFEFYPGLLPTSTPHTHQFFLNLRSEQQEAVLELPDLWWSSAAMRDQMVHQWPITGGYIARRDGTYTFRDQTPGVRQLMLDEPFIDDILHPSEEDQTLAALDASALRYVVMRHEVVAPPQFARIRRRLERLFAQQHPVVDDEQLLVYRVPAQPTRAATLMALGKGWYEPEHDGARRWRWVDGRGELFLTNTTTQPQPIHLRVQMSSFQTARRAEMSFDGRHLRTFDVAFQPQQLDVRVLLQPGRHTLTLAGLESGVDADGRRLSIVVTSIELVP